MSTHLRFAVRCKETGTFKGHRRYDWKHRSHTVYGAFEHARVWSRHYDAEKQLERGDEIVDVWVSLGTAVEQARFEAGEATVSDVLQAEEVCDKSRDNPVAKA